MLMDQTTQLGDNQTQGWMMANDVLIYLWKTVQFLSSLMGQNYCVI